MKTLHPRSCKSNPHTQHFDAFIRHPELTPGTQAQTDVELVSDGHVCVPEGTCCTVVGRTTFFADIEVTSTEKSETFHVPLHALKAAGK